MPVRAWRYFRLALHLLRGLLTVLLVFPLTRRHTHQQLRQNWSRDMLALLGVQLEPHGPAIAPGCLLVANHVSWLDIFVINALAPSAFVSKSEVRAWPLIGWLAARNDTVFLMRGSRGHAKVVNAKIAALLDAGDNVAVFPEGTTSDGSHILHFHAALLQPAIEAGHPVQPVALRYQTPDGRRSRAPAYDGDISLGECLSAIVATPALVARVEAFTPLPTDSGRHRREIAQDAREAIIEGVLGRGGLASVVSAGTGHPSGARAQNP
ncbi:MAG: lysophospholipid acyltransferase family protein [Rhodocyclaceae bacterium]